MRGVAVAPDGLGVHFEREGAGATPALVLVHGWSCDRSYWRYQVPWFAETYDVVAIDLAGHGDSGVERDGWTMRAFGDDVVAVVQSLELDELVLVGHSMGGDVVVEAALRLPGRVAGLVWVDVYAKLDEADGHRDPDAFMEPFREDFGSTTRDFARGLCGPGSNPEVVEWIAADMSSAPREIALAAMEQAITNVPAVVAGLEELALPVVAINPDSRPTDVDSLRRHGVDVVLMQGTGHFPMLEETDAFNRVLGDVIGDLMRRRSSA